MAKYAAKGEPFLKLIVINFKYCIDHHGNNNNTRNALQGAMLCCVDKHDYIPQEMVYLLFNLLLVSNTFI